MNLHLKILRQPNFFHRTPVTTTRCLATKSDSNPPRRTVILQKVSSLDRLSKVLGLNRVGPIEHIKLTRSQAYVSFFDQETAERFAQKVQQSKYGVDPIIYTGKQRRAKVEVVAAIGSYEASRSLVVNVPEDTTPQSFEREMSRFGEIEKAGVRRRINTHPNDERTYKIGVVHFLSIESAMKAHVALRDKARRRANFAIEEYDQPLTKMYRDFRKAALAGRQRPEDIRCVSLIHNEGGHGPIVRTLMSAVVKASLPMSLRGEVVQSIWRKGKELLVTFIHPEDALLFWNKCNSEGPACGFSNAILTTTPPDKSIFHISRAAAMGATRTLRISNVKDWSALTVKKIHSDFDQFGRILEVRIAEEKNAAFVKFANLQSSMRGICYIWRRNCVFKEAYEGSSVCFASDVALGNLPPELQALRIRSADDLAVLMRSADESMDS
ncbi:hypothetical protein L218DRAFT_993488 [Marasmius fiardii PR-910]|nr:hypothetical protein L218DRAFT_993488 [Marasmius fiardii PR-910]